MSDDAWAAAREEAAACRRCALFAGATQIVFGEGPLRAKAILVGEQPGDREDVAGRPFVGPAGGVLDTALAQAGLSRADLYLTNAVKHFKHETRGKRRLHKTPITAEIDACRWWLDQELALVEAPFVVTLGASALKGVAKGMAGRATISSLRGRPLTLGRRTLIVTVHPSYLLRLPDAQSRAREMRLFVMDLAKVAA